MTKFSTKKEVADTKNYMGEKAYRRNAKVELVNAVLTSFIENTYYEKADKRIDRISELVEKVAKRDPEFVAKLAIFARDQFNMRSSVHVLIGELAKFHRGDNLVGRAITKAAIRPDDVTEIVAYVKKPLPSQVKRGTARALRNFDEYQLAKYRGEGKEYSLVDVINLVRPIPTKAIQKLMKDQLRNTKTWEAKVSAAGGDKEKTDKAWKELLRKDQLGYMAALRNLRNIAETNDDETIMRAARLIADPAAVRTSRQFPFRFLSAFEALKGISGATKAIKFEHDDYGVPTLINAVEQAINASVQNLPLLKGKTAILSDNSGSMGGDGYGTSALSANSDRKTADIANLFATLYWMRANNTYVGLFGDQLVSPKLDRSKGVFDNYQQVAATGRGIGKGTEQGIYDFFEQALKERVKVDRIFIFSDMQIGKNGWYGYHPGTHMTFNQLFKRYKEFNPDVKVYSIDLRGYGTTVFSDGIIEFSGFSDKIFNIVELSEQSRTALIDQINRVEL